MSEQRTNPNQPVSGKKTFYQVGRILLLISPLLGVFCSIPFQSTHPEFAFLFAVLFSLIALCCYIVFNKGKVKPLYILISLLFECAILIWMIIFMLKP